MFIFPIYLETFSMLVFFRIEFPEIKNLFIGFLPLYGDLIPHLINMIRFTCNLPKRKF